MYRQYWGLRESPFRGALDPRLFFPSPTHEEALARLDFLVEERRRLGLLLGAPGTGKSLTLEVFARRLRRAGAQLANINLLGLDLHEFLWLAAAELGVNPDRRDDSFRLWRGVLDRLVENRYQQFDTVFLLDDADEASPELLEHLVRLAQLDGNSGTRLMIVLTAAPTAIGRFPQRILEISDLRIDIEPWESADTAQYITAALTKAGRFSSTFTEEALQRLHDLCDGIPRRVNQLANLSLLAAAGRKLPLVDTDTVDDAYHELGVVEAVA
jgi:general secretion pathway protein A